MARKDALDQIGQLLRQHDVTWEEINVIARGAGIQPQHRESQRDTDEWRQRKQVAIATARELILQWRISIAEITQPPNRTVRDKLTASLEPRTYRHPVWGHSWDGQGAVPAWMERALTVEGYSELELFVASAELK